MKIRITMLLLVVAMTAAGFTSCEKAPMGDEQKLDAKEAVAGETGEEVNTSPATVLTIAINSGGKSIPLSVEIAQTNEERAKGLLERESIPKNGGMWFMFPQMVQEKFHMNGMKFPLDIIFIDDGMKIVHIAENAQPNAAVLFESPKPFKYVLEANGGIVSSNGIKVGDSVEKRIGPE